MESLDVGQTAGCSDTDALLSDQDQGTHIKNNLCLNVYIGHNALVSPARVLHFYPIYLVLPSISGKGRHHKKVWAIGC